MPPIQKKRIWGLLIGGVGYVLSPLSWWNDLVVNIPLAFLVADAVSGADQKMFLPVMAGAYWATNILGLVLMQFGTEQFVTGKETKLDRRGVVRMLVLSLLYTLCVVALCQLGILKPIQSYFETAPTP